LSCVYRLSRAASAIVGSARTTSVVAETMRVVRRVRMVLL
jgi:hypothetical protein